MENGEIAHYDGWGGVKLNQNVWSYLPLNFEKLLSMTLFTLDHLQILTNQHQI